MSKSVFLTVINVIQFLNMLHDSQNRVFQNECCSDRRTTMVISIALVIH